jgi:hypothetical protein
VKGSSFDASKTGTPGEYMVELIGFDGMKHHVGPFKYLADAEAWIAQNPSDSKPKAPSRGELAAPRTNARIVE